MSVNMLTKLQKEHRCIKPMEKTDKQRKPELLGKALNQEFKQQYHTN